MDGMDSQKRKQILEQVRRDRAARRQVELEAGLPRVTGGIHMTSKKDRADRTPNTVRRTGRGGWGDEH